MPSSSLVSVISSWALTFRENTSGPLSKATPSYGIDTDFAFIGNFNSMMSPSENLRCTSTKVPALQTISAACPLTVIEAPLHHCGMRSQKEKGVERFHLHPKRIVSLKRIIRFFLYGDLVLASFQFGSERGRCVHSRYNPVISFFHPLARAEERNHAVHIAIAACRSVCIL